MSQRLESRPEERSFDPKDGKPQLAQHEDRAPIRTGPVLEDDVANCMPLEQAAGTSKNVELSALGVELEQRRWTPPCVERVEVDDLNAQLFTRGIDVSTRPSLQRLQVRQPCVVLELAWHAEHTFACRIPDRGADGLDRRSAGIVGPFPDGRGKDGEKLGMRLKGNHHAAFANAREQYGRCVANVRSYVADAFLRVAQAPKSLAECQVVDTASPNRVAESVRLP